MVADRHITSMGVTNMAMARREFGVIAHYTAPWAREFCEASNHRMLQCLTHHFPEERHGELGICTPSRAIVTEGCELDITVVDERFSHRLPTLEEFRLTLLKVFPVLRGQAWRLHLRHIGEETITIPHRPSCVD